MIYEHLTPEQEQWVCTQIKPAPTVFLIAYAGTGYKEWKLVSMMTEEKFLKCDPEALARSTYPSAMIVKVYRVKEGE